MRDRNLDDELVAMVREAGFGEERDDSPAPRQAAAIAKRQAPLPAVGAPEPPLSDKEKARIEAWKAKRADLAVPKFRAGASENEIVLSRGSDLTDASVCKATGVADANLAFTMLDQVAHTIATHTGEPAADLMNKALAAMSGLEPQDPLEGMLASQMVAAHNLAMSFAARATAGNPDELSLNVDRTTKMMRTFSAQIEALNRYRGKSQQNMRVEHVHVHAGGQAVVGNVASAPPVTVVPQAPTELGVTPVSQLPPAQESGSFDTIVMAAVTEQVAKGRGVKDGKRATTS